jgi:hypothetical protein
LASSGRWPSIRIDHGATEVTKTTFEPDRICSIDRIDLATACPPRRRARVNCGHGAVCVRNQRLGAMDHTDTAECREESSLPPIWQIIADEDDGMISWSAH